MIILEKRNNQECFYCFISPQVRIHSWTKLQPLCFTVTRPVVLKAGTAVPLYKEPVNTMMKRCGHCTPQSCVLTFYLSTDHKHLSPINYHFLSSLKDAKGLLKAYISVSMVALRSALLLCPCIASFPVGSESIWGLGKMDSFPLEAKTKWFSVFQIQDLSSFLFVPLVLAPHLSLMRLGQWWERRLRPSPLINFH